MRTHRKLSTIMLFLDVLRNLLIFIDLELKLAVTEVKGNVERSKKGIKLVAAGVCLLLAGLLLLTVSAVAALALVLPAWAAALLVAALFVAAGMLFFVIGRSRLKNSSPIPRKSLKRVMATLKKLTET